MYNDYTTTCNLPVKHTRGKGVLKTHVHPSYILYKTEKKKIYVLPSISVEASTKSTVHTSEIGIYCFVIILIDS